MRGWVRAFLGLGCFISTAPAWADVTGQEVGQRVPANISRNQLNFGFGYGRLDDWALFAGASFDFIGVRNAALRSIPNFDPGFAGQAPGQSCTRRCPRPTAKWAEL